MKKSQVLQIKNLTVSYPVDSEKNTELKALDDISINLNAAEIIGIVGESGAGKSTIGKAVLGLLDPPAKMLAGEIKLLGKSLVDLNESQYESLRGNQIGYIYQNPMTALNPVLTIGEQIIEAIEANTNMSGKDSYNFAIHLLERADVSFAKDRLQKYPHQLSGGLCQRIVFAIAISAKPKLIIADEPTTALDVTVQNSVLQTLIKLSKEEEIAIILITHDIGVVSETCDYVYVLRNGKHIEQGETAQVLENPKQQYTKSLMASVPLIEKRLHRFSLPNTNSEVNSLNLDYLKEERNIEFSSHQTILKIKNISKTFFTPASIFKPSVAFEAVKNVSFSVKRGETVGIVGESGSGKSTISDLIPRFHDVQDGTVSIDGIDVKEIEKAKLRNLISVVTQDSILFNDTVSENIKLGKQEATTNEVMNASEIANADEFINELPKQYETNIGDGGNKLSGGQKQRISIARAVLKNPPIMILDEATSALDTESEKLVQTALEKMMKNRTSLVIAHRLSTIQKADNIVVLRKGTIIEQGKHEELLAKKGEYFKLVTMQTLQ